MSGGLGGHYYAFLGRLEVGASDAVITGIVLVFPCPASMLFDLSSTNSYMFIYLLIGF